MVWLSSPYLQTWPVCPDAELAVVGAGLGLASVLLAWGELSLDTEAGLLATDIEVASLDGLRRISGRRVVESMLSALGPGLGILACSTAPCCPPSRAFGDMRRDGRAVRMVEGGCLAEP